MAAPSGQDTVNSANTSLTLLYSGTVDPTSVPIRAVAGTIYLGTGGTVTGQFFIKQDVGLTTNWEPLSGGGVTGIATTTLWVDMNRTDSYVPNGSISRPFKTITAALAQIIANGDNTVNKPYAINISPGIYEEAVAISNPKLVSLTINGNNTVIAPSVGNALTINTTATSADFSTGLQGLSINQVTFEGDVVVGLATQNAFALSGGFQVFDSLISGNFVCNGLPNFALYTTEVVGSISATNCNAGELGAGSASPGDVTLIWNPAVNHNSDVTAAVLILDDATTLGNISCTANATLSVRGGSRMSSSGLTTTVNGILSMSSGTIRGNLVVNAGATFSNFGGFFNPSVFTLAGGATYNNSVFTQQLSLTTPGADWLTTTPTDPQTAINRMAALLKTLNSGNPIP